MRGKRLLQTLHMFLTLNPHKRTQYLKDHHIFAAMGENCSIMDRKIPLYANLIKLGNNVHIASKVDFITHDIAHVMLNGMDTAQKRKGEHRFKEKIGCIEVGDNVFIGSNTTVLQDVRIGSNVVIGAGSLVNKDIPDNCVVGGVPARVLGTFDDFLKKRMEEKTYPDELSAAGEAVDRCLADWLWAEFDAKRRSEDKT